ncbi:hypothetical protein Hanom_Chr15g01366481 [Helianthus anomalus]
MWLFCFEYALLIVCELTCLNVTGKWSMFDFVDPLRNAALRASDRVIGEKEPDVLKIHLEQFLLPAVLADPAAYISQPPSQRRKWCFCRRGEKTDLGESHWEEVPGRGGRYVRCYGWRFCACWGCDCYICFC